MCDEKFIFELSEVYDHAEPFIIETIKTVPVCPSASIWLENLAQEGGEQSSTTIVKFGVCISPGRLAFLF